MGAVRHETLTPADLYITEELDRRAPKKADFRQEKMALQEIAAHMAASPEHVLPRFVDLALEIAGGVSAGLSLLEELPSPAVFRWRFVRGLLARFENATTPRDFSPCGVTLDCNAPVLSRHPERFYEWISDAHIVVPEVLLVPLYIGSKEPLGTLWIVSDVPGHFNRGHARVMTELATFLGIALRMLKSEKQLKDALEQQETLAKEMSHRVKNIFAVTASLLRASERAASTPAEMSEIAIGRLTALAEANALVRSSFSDTVVAKRAALAELIQKIMRPHMERTGLGHFIANGPAILLGERATNGMALVLHELATNAVKYGALKNGQGTVEISWRAAGDTVSIEWREKGGPPIFGPPKQSGFGTRLSTSTVVGQFRGELDYDWKPEGLVVSMKLPGAQLDN